VLFEHLQEASLRYGVIQWLCVRDQTDSQVGMKDRVLSHLHAFSRHLISALVVVACHFKFIFAESAFAMHVSCFTAADSVEFSVG